MADSDDNETETRLCTNCKRQIASSNFVMHDVHCRRHIVLCEYCDNPVPRAEIQEHFDELHAQVPCPICKKDMPKDQVESHKIVCPKKPVQCPYCELDFPGDELIDHQEFCGTRTEPCPLCRQYIMLKDSMEHERSNCTYPTPKPPTNNVQNQLFSPDDHFTFTNTPFYFDSMSEALRADSVSFPRREVIHSDSASVPRPGTLNKINNTHSHVTKPNTHGRVMKPNTHGRVMKPAVPSGLNKKSTLSKVNIVKASNVGAATANTWEKNSNREQDMRNADNARAPAGIQPEEDVVLPCEFCGEMYPLDVLIIHQSGCDPVAAHSPQPYSAVQETEGYDIGPDEDFVTPNTSNNHYRLSSSDRPIPVVDNLGHADNEGTYEVSGESGDVFPCEFCSDLFPESYLFQHQAICDANRTTTPAPASFRSQNRSEIMQETSPKSPPYSFNVGDYNLIDDEEMGYDVPDTWSRHNQSKSNVGKVSNIDRHGADNPGSAPSYTSKYGNSSLYTPNLFKKPLRETTITNRDMAPNGARPTKVRTNQDIGLIGRKAIKPKSNVDIATNGSRTQKSRNTGDLALLPRVQKVTPNRTLHNSGANGAAGRTHAVSRSDLYSKGELPDTNNAGKASKEDVNFVLRGDHSNYGKQTTATNTKSSQIRSRGGIVESGQSDSSRTSPNHTRRQMARLADEEETFPMMAHNLYSDPSHQTTRTATNLTNQNLDTENSVSRGRSNRRTFDPK